MATRKTGKRTFEVLISFSGMNRGERFDQEGDDLGWALQHVETGYLRDVTDEPTAAQAQAGESPARVTPERLEEAKNAGEVGNG